MNTKIAPDINLLLSRIEKEVSGLRFGKKPKELYEPIDYTMALGGKRIRPLFLLLANDLFGGKVSNAISPASAIEIFHNFTLVHDDIMDNAPLRRNKPTVYKKWNKNIALLSGDVMLVWAYRLLSKCDKTKFPAILEVFNKTAIEVCEGQQLDMNLEAASLRQASLPDGQAQGSALSVPGGRDKSLPDLTGNKGLESYIEMITLKTAVLIAGSLKIGAILGGADKKNANYLYEFGKNTGIAFQLQDDLLDAFGNIEKFGKQVGGDIIANKKTFLVLKAFELADEKTKATLHRLFSSNNTAPQKKVEEVKAIYEKLGIKGETEKAMRHYYSLAVKQLSKVSANEKKKQHLLEFVGGLMRREG